MDRIRKTKPGQFHHYYQNTVNGALLFYSISDYLVCYSLACLAAHHHSVRVLSFCMMPDHLHGGIVEECRGGISGFVQELESRFSRMQNDYCGLKGSLFNSRFGCAPKKRDKDVRSTLIYLDNNPVERYLCKKAEEYRWNFTAYASGAAHWSKPLILRRVSAPLYRACKRVVIQRNAKRPLTYPMLKQMISGLNLPERKQLIDYIIRSYSFIQYDEANRFFDTYEDRIRAAHSYSAREHDINEKFVGKSDAHYAGMIHLVMEKWGLDDIHKMLLFSEDQKMEVKRFLRSCTDVPIAQVAKFLRI